MIVRIHSHGTSFKGTAAYLAHDINKAQTADRVEWTHTHNLANDDVAGAVNEMVWTARDAELLKQEAGIRAGGRATENTVKHFSLNWSPTDHPTKEHMIETTDHFVRHMGWHEHQAIYFSHTDKPYSHVHVMLNTVHPATGLRLDENFERRRAQARALDYEREQGRIYCEQRLDSPQEREKSPPRNIWMAFQENQKEFEKAEKSLGKNTPILVGEPENRENSEWKILKEFHRAERMEFFAQGKSEFKDLRNSIYREVRSEFRERWSDYYEARRNGADADALTAMKAELVADQKTILDARRDEACKELRASRDEQYRTLLDGQRESRAELRWRQEAGLDNALFLNELGDRSGERNLTGAFHESAREVTSPDGSSGTFGRSWVNADEGATMASRDEDIAIGGGLKSSLISFFDSLAYDLINLGSARPTPVPQTDSTGRRFTDIAAEEATKERLRQDREKEDDEWRRRERSRHGG